MYMIHACKSQDCSHAFVPVADAGSASPSPYRDIMAFVLPCGKETLSNGCLVLIGKTEGITVTELDETDMLLEEMHPNPVTNGTCM